MTTEPISTPDLKHEPWLSIARAARVRWGNTTPYRLGFIAASKGLCMPNPYTLESSRTQYAEGERWGTKEARQNANMQRNF